MDASTSATSPPGPEPRREPEPRPADAGSAADEPDPAEMDLLRAGVPLSLLLDLAEPEGPHSRELLEHETAPDSIWYRTPRIARGDC